MSSNLTGADIRKTLLEVVEEYSGKGPGFFQQDHILIEAAKRLGIRGDEDMERALLTAWHDQFSGGHLAWGHNLANPGPPYCHITDRGRETLSNLSRDPVNASGYMTHLKDKTTLNPVTESYLREALRTFNANCFKATAVMVGCAAESLTLEVRDELVAKMRRLKKTVPKKLEDWRIRTVIEALKKEFDSQKSTMDRKLCEEFESYWPAFIQQIRAVRNEAGHPISVEPVTDRRVHTSLLIFPELAFLSQKLREWIQNTYR